MYPFIKSVRKALGRSPKTANKSAPRARLEFEGLEERLVMSVTNHGGATMPNVEVQALYYGSDWYNNSTYYNQTGYLEGFLNNVVHSSYMDMLGKAGYGVGRGSFDGGKISLANVDKSVYLTDSSIQGIIQSYINNGTLKAADSNRLYVFFVEPNVAVKASDGTTSQGGFRGYHGAFTGYNLISGWLPSFTTIHYAVIPYPGGTVGNSSVSFLSAIDSVTKTTSHEIAEAATDANVGYSTLGWYDDAKNGEIGDINNDQVVKLNGYAVQRLVDQNDQPMTPAGAVAFNPVSFVLQTNDYLWEHSASGWTYLSSGIASISDQGIDNHGKAMIDVVTTGGFAYEYHDGSGWFYLTSGVKNAVAGQGVSYVQYTNGNLYEYTDASKGWTYVYNNVSAISAGTDKSGVNAVDVIFTWGDAWEHSDSSGWRYITSGVRSISAGQQGILDYVTTAGNAYWYNEATGATSYLGANVAQVTAGVDQFGNYMIDLLYTGGNLYEYRAGSGWTFLDGGVKSISKARAALIDAVFTWGDAYEHGPSGWNYLTSSVSQAV